MSRFASAIPLHEWRTRRRVPPARRGKPQKHRKTRHDLAPATAIRGEELGGVRDGLARAAGRVQDALTPGWGPEVEAGANLRIRARKGFRAAVVEVKPGLYVVAEVPERAVEFGFGPLLLAPALAKTLTRAMRKRRDEAGHARRKAPLQLHGPTEDEGDAGDELPRWLDDEDAAELGCARCEREEP